VTNFKRSNVLYTAAMRHNRAGSIGTATGSPASKPRAGRGGFANVYAGRSDEMLNPPPRARGQLADQAVAASVALSGMPK
jgi:hypothetical protein